VVRNSDNAVVGPDDPVDWATFQAWLAAGNTPSPAPPPPAPVPSAALWQLKAICDSPPSSLGFTPPTWAQIQTAAASLNNSALSDFIAAFAPQPIPENATTIASLNAALPTPMTAAQLLAFFSAAAAVSIP
jgi:hypothetical protein